MKLKPYHNPENVDESKVPDGWRFKYDDEKNIINMKAKFLGFMCCDVWHPTTCVGRQRGITYIVPVAL